MAVQRRNTRQRKLVLDAVRQSYNHPTADEIYNVVRAQDDKISRGTVYRNLNLLADAGEILSIKTPGGSRFDRTIEPHAPVDVWDMPTQQVDDAAPLRPYARSGHGR